MKSTSQVKLKIWVWSICFSLLVGCSVPVPTESDSGESSTSETKREKPSKKASAGTQKKAARSTISKPSDPFQKGFSFAYWLNGWRKQKGDNSPDILCIETDAYGFTLDVATLTRPRFGTFEDDVDYVSALKSDAQRLQSLSPASLELELDIAGTLYRAVSCKAGQDRDVKHLRSARMWESGRWVQHFDLQELVFKDAEGNPLTCFGQLDLVAWPDSLTLTAEIAPGLRYQDGAHPGVRGAGLCVVNTPMNFPVPPQTESKAFTLEAWVKVPESLEGKKKGYLICKNGGDETDGNIGFKAKGSVLEAVMNIGGGLSNQNVIRQQKEAFHPNVWNHLVMTYDGKTMAFYINGDLQGRKSINKTRIPGTGPLEFGKPAQKGGEPTKGLFDQVLLWNRPLSYRVVEEHAEDAGRVVSPDGLVYQMHFKTRKRIADKKTAWANATMRLRLKTETEDWRVEETVPNLWASGDRKSLILNCPVGTSSSSSREDVSVEVRTADKKEVTATFDAEKNCYVARVEKIKRPWEIGYTDIRNYDDVVIRLENTGDEVKNVPVLLELMDVANITGLCPMLCDEEGVPTGVPVQISKNWHFQEWGAYLRAYTMVPTQPGISTYMMRIAYGFYGTLPSASHAQLCLVGYGGNGRWDQMAIGCWGETMCLDMDMSLVDVAITDVRMLMTRKGLKGKKWTWTDGGWGGDWLNVLHSNGEKHYFSEMKTAYVSQGPCLTEVHYDGKYGSQREVDMEATVRTLRTDDYARTFQTFRYRFDQSSSAEKGWLFKMGRTGGLVTPKLAYGHGEGLIQERDVAGLRKVGENFLAPTSLTGPAPWWVAFPGAYSIRDRNWGTGSRALVIRAYRATFGGKVYTTPSISMPVHQVHKDGQLNLDLLLLPPPGVTNFLAGDEVEMDVEWITLPRVADDYYGPNEAFRQHLTDYPEAWETVYREAKGNDLKVQVQGGTELNNYPLLIQAKSDRVKVTIQGGVGMVPIRFEGLPSATAFGLYQKLGGKLILLDQSVHGNDFWQTTRDSASNTFSLTFNLPLDGREKSTWVLMPLADSH